MIRERTSALQETESRRITEWTNHTMYLLGIVAGFLLPMSLATGLLGINVGGIPEADASHGFRLTCLLIDGITTLQWWVFCRLHRL